MHTGETVSATEHILALRKYPRKPSYMLAALEDVYAHFGHIPEAAKTVIREYFAIRRLPKHMEEALFHASPMDRRTVRVCAGPLCIQAGSDKLATELASLPGITVERQYCMGVCHSAPAAKIGIQTVSEASFAKIRRLAFS